MPEVGLFRAAEDNEHPSEQANALSGIVDLFKHTGDKQALRVLCRVAANDQAAVPKCKSFAFVALIAAVLSALLFGCSRLVMMSHEVRSPLPKSMDLAYFGALVMPVVLTTSMILVAIQVLRRRSGFFHVMLLSYCALSLLDVFTCEMSFRLGTPNQYRDYFSAEIHGLAMLSIAIAASASSLIRQSTLPEKSMIALPLICALSEYWFLWGVIKVD